MKRTILAIFATLLMASYSVAGTSATNTNKVSPTVQFSANIVDAVVLTITKGSTGSACTIGAGSSGNDYAVDFGTVDALAINNGSCGQKFTPAQTGSHAVYYTDYTLNPVWASQPNVAGPTITAYVSTAFGAANIKMVRDTNNSATAPAANGFSLLSTNSGTPDTIVSAAASGTPQTRWIGVDLDPSQNGAGLTGAQQAVVTFTLTVQ